MAASSSSSSSSSRSWKYDVFLSFRGQDTRRTFVDHLYSALKRRSIRTYKDDETLDRGDTIGPSLLNAIEESQIALIIFSENYANSPWCLDELAFIMKCREERGQIVMPIFYDIEPSEVRNQKRKYEEAFAKHKSDYNNNKVESWRTALVDASNIAGWETKHIANGHEAKAIENIESTIIDKFLSLNSIVDENLVGMGTRLQDLKSQLKMKSGGVCMVGIWGIGGCGKTTLASSLYMNISSEFDSCCFLENIKDGSSKLGMKNLQEKILSDVLKREVKLSSVEIGKHTIKGMLRNRNVFVVLDDVDDRKQLEALAGSHDWFGDGSRIIITTRDEHLLTTHRVDGVYQVGLLSDEEAIRLFNRRAYNKDKLVEDYEMLSQRVVSYAAGLPLAIIVLGSFLYDKDKDEWNSTLNRLKDIPEMEIMEKLKISYDGLKPLEKELFLDIACFFCRGKDKELFLFLLWRREKNEAMEILDACGFHPRIGVKVLIQKGLITISEWGGFDMHDLVQEMGHYIVRGEHPNNLETRSRLWIQSEIEDMCSSNATMENERTEAIQCINCPSSFGKLVSNAKKLRLLYADNFDERDSEVPEYLSNELRYMYWRRYLASPFPKSFQPRKLVVLSLHCSLQKELWRGYKYLPCLKELDLSSAYHLVKTPDFGGLPCLQKLTLDFCDNLEEIHPSLGNHSSLVNVKVNGCNKLEEFPTIVQMGKLEILEISSCQDLSKFPKIEGYMDSLVNLSLEGVGIEALPSTVGKYCTKLRLLKVDFCHNLESIEGNFHALKLLQNCNICTGSYSRGHIKLPKDLFHEHIHLEELHLYRTRQPSIPHLPCFLRRLTLRECELIDGEIPSGIGELSNLQELNLSSNGFSRLNFSLSQLSQLKLLNLDCCINLVELPELPTSIAILNADCCESLEVVGDIINPNCKWLRKVSLCKRLGTRSVIGGDRLLQTMLQGNTTENGCMTLQLDGLEIPNGFIPRLLRGGRYRLELPENWHTHFSGFLFCAATKRNFKKVRQTVCMKHTKGEMASQQDVYWKESVDDKETWVRYVSFGSLKRTEWWDPTFTSIDFSFEKDLCEGDTLCSGIGVRLVSNTSSKSETTITDSSSQSSDDYNTCNFTIQHDSKSHLRYLFKRE